MASLHNSAAGLLDRWRFPVRYPMSAVEISPSEVAAVRLRKDRARPRLAGYGVCPIQNGAEPAEASPAAERRNGSESLRSAIMTALRSAGIRSGKASLVLADSMARVWLLQLPEIPRGRESMLDMIRWKIKKSVPFRIEDGALSWQILVRPSGSDPAIVLVGLVPRAILVQYEKVLSEAGLKVGLIDLASFNVFNAYRQSITEAGVSHEDFAVLNATETYFTLMLFRDGELIFFRCKTHADAATEESPSPAEERARTFRRELATSLSYYTEKLKGERVGRVFARIADPGIEGADDILRSVGFETVETIDPGRIAFLPETIDPREAIALVPAMSAAVRRSR